MNDSIEGFSMDFTKRCEIANNCLPKAEYRDHLEKLHNEMLGRIKELEFYKENRTCTGCWGEKHHCDCGAADT